MAETKFNLTSAIKELEDINRWFQEEDIDLEEGLQRLKKGKELIKQCRDRLHNVENEFLKIKAEFAEEKPEENLKLDPDDLSGDLPF